VIPPPLTHFLPSDKRLRSFLSYFSHYACVSLTCFHSLRPFQIREIISETEKPLPDGFKDGILCIYKLQTFSLKNTEIMGTQDPYVRVRIGDTYKGETYSKDNGGSDVLFDSLDLKAPVTVHTLQTGRVEFEAWDRNSKIGLRGDVLIGAGSAGLEGVRVIGESVEVSVQLTDKKGKSAGRILAFLRLETAPPVDISPIGIDFTEGTVHIRKIASFGLHNTEVLAVFGEKQDPYVILTAKGLGVDWTGTTPILTSAGANCVWDFLDFKFDVTRDQLVNGILDVAVKEKNKIRGDGVIGVATIDMRNINRMNNLLEISVDLKITDKKGAILEKSRGKLVAYIELTLKEKTIFSLQKGFKFGKLQITKIQTFNLKNTELGPGSLQDPYCVLKLGENWTEKTSTQQDVGGDVLWNYLTLKCDVNAALLEVEQLVIEVFDKNTTRKDCLIGSGTVSLLKCGACVGAETDLSISLLDAKSRPAGRVIVYAKISETEEEADIIIPSTFTDGQLKIKRVTLTNTTIGQGFHLSKSEPYVVLKLLKFDERTKKCTQKDESNVSWTDLDYSVACDAKAVQSSEVAVEVWVHTTLQGDVMVSTARVPVRKSGGSIGVSVEITRDLVGVGKAGTGAAAGTVTLLCQLEPSKIVLKEPELGIHKHNNMSNNTHNLFTVAIMVCAK
jgi:C2 domain